MGIAAGEPTLMTWRDRFGPGHKFLDSYAHLRVGPSTTTDDDDV